VKNLFNRISNLFDQSPSETSAPAKSAEPPVLDRNPSDGSAPDVEKIITDLQAYIASKSRHKLDPHEVSSTDSLWSAGHIDSLSYVEFLMFIERQYGVIVPDVQLSGQLNSLEALGTFIVSTMNHTAENND
jgi:acyl carrier protein